jgi:acyl-CoA thioester hydrolase
LSDAVILQTLVHSLSGQTCATFLTTVAHAAARHAKVFPWPARTHALAAGLSVAVPQEAQPRGVVVGPAASIAGMAKADALGLAVVGRGAVGAPDCDVFGRMRAEMVLHRVSMGIPHFVEPLRLAAQEDAPDARVGGAALEYRIAYAGWPKAGDPVQLRSGFAEIQPKYARMVHWLLDPRTGAAYASAEHVGANFDLDARRVLAMPPQALARMRTLATPGLAI